MTLFEKANLPKETKEVAPSELVKRIIASPSGDQSVLVLKANPAAVVADIIKTVKSENEARRICADCVKAKYSKDFEGSSIEGIPVGVVPTVVEEPKVATDSSGAPSATFKGDWLLILPREGYAVKDAALEAFVERLKKEKGFFGKRPLADEPQA